ncbi:trypsin-like peptidase domain-containing protein [Bradyrhizobium sp. ARR65]|uniref:trypsin-like peptidase domain-containing protein n=1 Tax=Bradyrhizobium sp. ARR65 TaxID=1040989 RepID=UPI000A6E80BD|nr:trypsin-like peptidase domain-containing protein [Bradyrhizobium sp. ARR65]
MIFHSGRRIGACTALLLVLMAAPTYSEHRQPSHAEFPQSSLAPLVNSILPSVVAVTSTKRPPNDHLSVDPAAGFPDAPLPQDVNVIGSGVIVDADLGLIVTSQHVVEDAEAVTVAVSDGRRLGAAVIAASQGDDLAILKIAPGRLNALALGHADGLQIGDVVFAVGHPLGRGQSTTFGIISALHRSCPGIENADLIVTDALIERGNSGGPLINGRGELVGINVARSRRPDAPGFGFAVPVAAVRAVLARARLSG